MRWVSWRLTTPPVYRTPTMDAPTSFIFNPMMSRLDALLQDTSSVLEDSYKTAAGIAVSARQFPCNRRDPGIEAGEKFRSSSWINAGWLTLDFYVDGRGVS